MEAMKISVEVSVNFSESTQQFIKSLFGGACQCSNSVAPAKHEEPKKAPAAPAATSKTIEDVRAELAKKVNDHRDAIKAKLTEFGAPSVTKLDPSKYDEMYNFLTSL